MEKQKTFVDNWNDTNNDLFQLLISDQINQEFNYSPPNKTPIFKKELSKTDSIYYLEDTPILGVRYNPEQSTHILYVNESRKDNNNRRRSESISKRYALPTAGSK